MCERDTFDRVVGLVLIATKTVRNKELKGRLNNLPPRSVVWMHGDKDHIIPIEAAPGTPEMFSGCRMDGRRISPQERAHG